LRGYLMLAERLAEDPVRFASGWNFGPGGADTKPVCWIADELAALWGGGASWQLEDGAHPHESMLLRLDATKAEVCLGWTPRVPLRQTLEWTAEWYRLVQQNKDFNGLTREQIERYEMVCGDRIAMRTEQAVQQ